MPACRVVDPDQWCRRCGGEGGPRDTVVRQLAHEPLGRRSTILALTVRRYLCTGCGRVWRQDMGKATEPPAKLSRRGLRWALAAIVVQRLTVARAAEGLGVAWNTANDAVPAEDMVEGRSKQAFKTWLADRDEAWHNQVEVVATDGFTAFKTATAEELPHVVVVRDPFHVVRLASDALDKCRRRVQRAVHGHRGMKNNPLHPARRTLQTGVGRLTDKQKGPTHRALR